MDVDNGTKTPTDTRVSSGGGSGFHQYPPKPDNPEAAPGAWKTIQPGETASFDLRGPGPWKVEIRVLKNGRWTPKSEIVRTPYDRVTLVENGGEVELKVSRRAAAS